MKNYHGMFRKEYLFSILYIISLSGIESDAFLVSSRIHPRQTSSFYLQSGEEEPDLFDYFDPLLSPHEYPNGISPDSKPEKDLSEAVSAIEYDEVGNDDRITSVKEKEETVDAATEEFFDPLLSPHMYPNGTPDKVIGEDVKKKASISAGAEFKAEPVGSETSTTIDDFTFTTDDEISVFSSLIESATKEAGNSIEEEASEILPADKRDSFDVFDPIVSSGKHPIEIAKKDDTDKSKDKKRLVGVLLIDHGSRNKASNEGLQELARLYQDFTKGDSNDVILVEAAHMEIATPSIPDGLMSLINQGVDEIVCHPYFLSAKGRHVSEDIPEIIDSAISSLKISVPITTTEPVGSSTDIILGAIQSIVKNNLKELRISNGIETVEQPKRFGF